MNSSKEVQCVGGAIYAMMAREHIVLYCSSDEYHDVNFSMGAVLNHGVCSFRLALIPVYRMLLGWDPHTH
jgi:hypothetical protein